MKKIKSFYPFGKKSNYNIQGKETDIDELNKVQNKNEYDLLSYHNVNNYTNLVKINKMSNHTKTIEFFRKRNDNNENVANNKTSLSSKIDKTRLEKKVDKSSEDNRISINNWNFLNNKSNKNEIYNMNNDIINYKLRNENKYIENKNMKENKLIKSKQYIYKKLIVFDYDDTILPTSWITVKMKLGLFDVIPKHIRQLFNKLSNVVINTLRLCLTQGKLVIVTNASLEWLINSAKNYIPLVWSFIVHNNIRIVSARDTLVNTFVDSKDWKKVIFHQIINELLSPYLYNTSFICFIYSVGDGNDERNACFFISQLNQYSSCIFKSLKFLPEPTCQKLIAEHELFSYFMNGPNNSPKMWSYNVSVPPVFPINFKDRNSIKNL
ncbi:HAD domain ookinete protein [Plasmodium berghei]|uniref:HAD domain ookinete protein n=2 Tax=Plasmodium berghei TaxID=5821 RepID=A0A509AH64_PLABA|nr:HAD domain ookinete protein [Plasmodium berghei ANKA]CXI15894.1 HAD domain ookinete protein [Plasmodium berghei]SCM19587.1 HAD domain ookinete protein [Plasmodium berghei]SCN23331.1 HAD domain ookinete protein [Plasmodium berghei]SCO59028.1 HAD domain ookinete protein [Plasmodium berghei]SCO59582.1 HAD domain ookinete protein [Plasmodium berghei]|eukprot:XP_034420540.1 HAD domain ookinete protein [Plasmodium berghei ANKA]